MEAGINTWTDLDCLTLFTAQKQEAAPAETVYTVVKGDTLWGIARKLLGSGYRYTEIVALNGLKTSTIYSGQQLRIPKK